MGKKSRKPSAVAANPSEFGSPPTSSASVDNGKDDSNVIRRSKRRREGGKGIKDSSWLTNQLEDAPPYAMQVFVWLAVFLSMQYVVSFGMKNFFPDLGENGQGRGEAKAGGEL